MIQIWQGTNETEGRFMLELLVPIIPCEHCRKVIHDLKHNVWPEGKQLVISPDINIHGKNTGFHIYWTDFSAEEGGL